MTSGIAMLFRGRVFLLVLVMLLVAVPASAQTTAPAWSGLVSGAIYFLPDEQDYLQPTALADRGAWHLEARYNYEGENSLSGFVGWNLEFGEAVVLQLTPMIGAVVGDTDGIVPAVELDLAWKCLEFYGEGEYVLDTNDFDDRFLYSWTEASIWLTEHLRTGLVTQWTRNYNLPSEIQSGLIGGANIARFETAVFFFKPFSDDYSVVLSVGLTF